MCVVIVTFLSDDLLESFWELCECFEVLLVFGTVGLRGILGPGPGWMNWVTVCKVIVGLV